MICFRRNLMACITMTLLLGVATVSLSALSEEALFEEALFEEALFEEALFEEALFEESFPLNFEESMAPAQGTALIPPGTPLQAPVEPFQVRFQSTVSPEVQPYPTPLLDDAGKPFSPLSDAFSPVIELFVSSLISTVSRSGKVFGVYLFKEGPYAEYIQASVSLLGNYFIAAKTNTPVDVESSLVESSLESLESLGVLSESEVLQSIATKPESYGGLVKRYLPKIGLIYPSYLKMQGCWLLSLTPIAYYL